jgi:hypothetical protein
LAAKGQHIGVWVFDCAFAHEGLALDALNVNNMNVHPGGKQTLMCNTIIPLTNPAPNNGKNDKCGQPQTMVYLLDHPDLNLVGKVKGMAAVVGEQKSVYK